MSIWAHLPHAALIPGQKSRVIGITPKYRALLTSVGFTPGRPFDYVPEHTWAFGITYAHNRSTASLNLIGVGMLYKSDVGLVLAANTNNRLQNNIPRTALPVVYRSQGSGYVTADLNATRRVGTRIDLLVQALNLTNYYQNDFGFSYPSIGRQTKVGMRIRWR